MKNLGFANQPGQGEPIADPAGRVTRVWSNYFAKLALVQTSDELRDLYVALAERVGKLEDGQALTIIGRNSVRTVGTGQVEIQLVGDENAPGNTEYYGTNASGEKGFHPVADAIEVQVAELTKAVGLDGIITIGLADVPDSGTGTLQAITVDAKGRITGTKDATITGTAGQIAVANGNASSGLPTISLVDVPDVGGGVLQKTQFDGKGRKTGTSAATTDDLPEGSANLYFTAARASAAAPVQSVNTKTGAVVLGPSDVGAQPASANLTAWAGILPSEKADASALTALDADTVKRLGNINQVSTTNQWRLETNRTAGSYNVALRMDSGAGFNPANGAIFELNGANEPTRPGACRMLAVAGAPITFATGSFGFNLGATVSGLSPSVDNTHNLGNGSARWKEVFAGSSVINTSDAREKTPVRPLTPAETAAAAALGGEIGVYQWLAMIATKGDGARRHIGMTVQRAIEIMQSHGLDPFAYGFICYDQWDELPEIRSEDGELVQEARPAGDRYSFRMDELLAFIARGLARRLDGLEQRLRDAGL